jgi:hypothetical protein
MKMKRKGRTNPEVYYSEKWVKTAHLTMRHSQIERRSTTGRKHIENSTMLHINNVPRQMSTFSDTPPEQEYLRRES